MEVKYKTEFISLFNELNQNHFQLTKFSKYLEVFQFNINDTILFEFVFPESQGIKVKNVKVIFLK